MLFSEWKTYLDNHGNNYDYDDNGRCFGDGGGISTENFKLNVQLDMAGKTMYMGN